MKFRFPLRKVLLSAVLVIAGYLLLAPTRIEPVAWQPAPAPSLKEGVYAENTALAGIERIGPSRIAGPEALLVDTEGFLITGLHDGRVIRTSLDGNSLKVLANTGGRPLGLALHPDGRLIIADAVKGLLALAGDGTLTTLSTRAGNIALGFTDDVVIDAAGRFAYFSDASSRWGYGEHGEAVMEHGGDGRLLRYDFETGATDVLVHGLEFANGVALGPDEAFVLVNETGAYRIKRLWLKGNQAGTTDNFIDNLPGMPDNLSFNGKDRFWVALYSPRNPLLDVFAPYPFIRKMLARAMQVIPPPVEHRAMALGLDTEGRVIANLQDAGSDNYSPVTSVREVGEWLYFGSLQQTRMARLPLAVALPEAAAKP